MPQMRTYALKDAIARATPNTPLMFKAQATLDALYESSYFSEDVKDGVSYARMAEMDAEAIVLELLTEATNVDAHAVKAWDRIGETLIELGHELARHDKVMVRLIEDLQIS